MKIMVSACLLGDNVKYNGGNNRNIELIKFLDDYEIVKICPEVMGMLSIPRCPAEIKSGNVINKDGIDVTNNYFFGAKKVLELAKSKNIKIAILKEKSPSCGSNYIYDGTFTNTIIKGIGITSKILKDAGIEVLNENNYLDYFSKVKK